jgi:hypothetical protein
LEVALQKSAADEGPLGASSVVGFATARSNPVQRNQDMTSIDLRRLALAGAAIAALGMAACSKPAVTNDTNTAADTTTPDNGMSGMSNMTTDTTTTNNVAS